MRSSAYIGTDNTNQSFFLDILKTIPVEVPYAEVSFLAEGIPNRGLREDPDEKSYIEACQSKGVIPFSRAKLEYNERAKVFLPNNGLFRSFLEVGEESSETRKNAAIKGLLNGGRINILDFEIGFGRYGYFQKEYLEQIVGAGYQIDETDLWLSTYSLTGYNEGTYRENGLRLGRTYITKGVELEVPELTEWFTNLANKHGVEILERQEAENSEK